MRGRGELTRARTRASIGGVPTVECGVPRSEVQVDGSCVIRDCDTPPRGRYKLYGCLDGSAHRLAFIVDSCVKLCNARCHARCRSPESRPPRGAPRAPSSRLIRHRTSPRTPDIACRRTARRLGSLGSRPSPLALVLVPPRASSRPLARGGRPPLVSQGLRGALCGANSVGSSTLLARCTQHTTLQHSIAPNPVRVTHSAHHTLCLAVTRPILSSMHLCHAPVPCTLTSCLTLYLLSITSHEKARPVRHGVLPSTAGRNYAA